MEWIVPAAVLDVWRRKSFTLIPPLVPLLTCTHHTLVRSPHFICKLLIDLKLKASFAFRYSVTVGRIGRSAFPPPFVLLNPAGGACHQSPGRGPLSLSCDIQPHRIRVPAGKSIAAIMLLADHIVATLLLAVVCVLRPVLADPARDSVFNSLQKEKKVILVLVDGVRYDYVKDPALKGFQRMARKGVKAEYVQPIFPSNSYPNWYTIVTGTHLFVFAVCLLSCTLPVSAFPHLDARRVLSFGKHSTRESGSLVIVKEREKMWNACARMTTRPTNPLTRSLPHAGGRELGRKQTACAPPTHSLTLFLSVLWDLRQAGDTVYCYNC